MKSGVQLMFESMLGEAGVKAIDECKRILPSVPELIENIKREWQGSREQQTRIERLLERVATQNNLILGKLESLEFKVDPNKTEELPPTLAYTIRNLNMVTCSHCGHEVPDLIGCIHCGFGVVEYPDLPVKHDADCSTEALKETRLYGSNSNRNS